MRFLQEEVLENIRGKMLKKKKSERFLRLECQHSQKATRGPGKEFGYKKKTV